MPPRDAQRDKQKHKHTMHMHARSLGLVKLNSRVAAVANGRLAVNAPIR
jgi:hypothetical protein